MSLIEDLTWRYATKKMNGERIPADKLNYILEAARLAPSSSGLQPYKILVISDPALLAKIREVSFNQSQVTDCSHLLVFVAWDGYSEERITRVFNYTMDQRGLPYQTMADYKQNLWSMYEPLGPEWHAQHAAKQSYIAFAMAIAAAAEQRVDATPIEGFNADQLDTLLQLKGSGYRSAVLLPLGYRQESEDWLVNMKKVRTPMEEFATELTLADLTNAEDQAAQ
ncbi:nitroreductase family protein [Hymenobacter canadensis]|uniref:Nitroreductase family protein n=1 Tax=Hymenobacter canadensis TaxID=2999067 RepID=A0ABY7LVF9_9BACT|nr:nitroreductase family protein [Hymenobacter canadensis]WBA44036.1 nitroreductase family protein [Hymenobacter canadensis]